MLAKHALSQLSYSPKLAVSFQAPANSFVVGLGRVELPTSPLSGVRSNQLSYRPVFERPHCKEPGSSYQPYSVLKKVSRTRLNVLGGYAAHDHRANTRSSKEGLIQDSCACRQERLLQVR